MPKSASKGKPIRVRVARVAIDPEKRTLIFLATPKRHVPIWMGMFEGQAIVMAMKGQKMPRPMTHDLLLNALRDVGWQVERLVVTDLAEQTFFGELHLRSGRKRKVIDCRPSDGVALALRAKAPIYVAPRVFELGGVQGSLPEKPALPPAEPEKPKRTKRRRKKPRGK